MSRKIIVNKFGGGILKSELIHIIAKRLKEQLSGGFFPIVVVSAMPGITDKLISLKENGVDDLIETHKKIMSEMGFNDNAISKIQTKLDKIYEDIKKSLKSKKEKDQDKIVSSGEKISAIILSDYFNSLNIPSKTFLAEDIPIITDANFKNANIKYDVSEKNVRGEILKSKEIPVIAGFTGVTEDGQTTTLGRGGTDTTACFIGSALRANKIILWKDVGGILSADPRIITKARTIPFINYLEAEEAGKIIHDKAISYIKLHKTPIEIASIINPKLKTEIGEIKKIEKGAKIVNVKNDLNFILITDEAIKMSELLFIVSEIFKKYQVDITLISNTRYSLQIITDDKNNQLDKAYNEIKSKVNKISMTKASMVFLVGLFDAKDVSNFNDLLVRQKVDLLISAFYYEDCYRMEAVIKTDDINEITKAVYNKFIKVIKYKL